MGLNPMLQNFWMVSHPPLLFIGYASFLMPFVIACAAVLAGRIDCPPVYEQMRFWLLFGISFLGMGILTGARWAYLELGWGGYWVWDPVENASLMPLLAAVAALHSLIGIRYWNEFRFWALVLAGVPFILSLLATFITRTGIVQSIHAFGNSVMFHALLTFMSACLVFWLICINRASKGISPSPIPLTGNFFNRTRLLFCGNAVLMATCAIITIATLWPVMTPVFGRAHPAMYPTALFYNRIISVAAIILAFLLIVTNPLSGLKGGRIAHIGFLLLIVTASFTSWEQVLRISMAKGQKETLGRYSIQYESFRHESLPQQVQTGPEIILRKNLLEKKLWPHNNTYANGQSTSEVEVYTGWLEDIYISFGGMASDGRVMIEAKIKPMMLWFWIAGGLIVAGAAVAMFEGKRTSNA
jgi:cytochrome c-type biogenesis protein NrfE